MLDELTKEDFKAEIDFLGLEQMNIKTTNAQEIFNYYQSFPLILIWDMRAKKHYQNCHLKWSVNLPVDKFVDDDFINFDPQKIIEKHFESQVDKDAFKKRRRSMVFIVAHRTCSTRIFQSLANMFDYDKVWSLKNTFSSQDILATRNSVLLYKALRKDNHREVYIWRNSFNAIQGKYPFLWKFSGSSLYLNPKGSNGYPNEVIDRRLYIGDATHASNKTIMHNLGITHILNVSNNIPNTFQDSKDHKITYQKINIEDSKEVPIELSFKLAYDFIENTISKKKSAKMQYFSTKFDLIQNFTNSRKKSMVLVSSSANTNDLILDLNNMWIEEKKNKLKDKIFDIDSRYQYDMQTSNNQNRILVHWAMGRSRSATMVIMWMMRKCEISFKMAFDILKSRREIIDPNEGFIDSLEAYEGKQYKLKRTLTFTFKDGDEEEIREEEEFSGYDKSSNSSSSSEEDLMEKRRSSFDL
jgi:rhodanese-related sulfurtransferase